MDAQNNPSKNEPDAGIGGDNSRWRLVLLALCAVGVGLLIGILALQVTEYRFYKAAPNVWPQPGAVGMVSAPVKESVPLPPVMTTTSSTVVAPASTQEVSTGQTSAPVAAPVSMPTSDVDAVEP